MATRRAGLDQIDRKILNCLQRNCRITNEELAKLVGTSAPTCLRRVRMLRNAGYIEREIALVDPEKVGPNLIAISEVRLMGTGIHVRDKVIKIIKDTPEIILCYIVTGNRDFIIISFLTDMDDFEQKVGLSLESIPEIVSINTYFAMRCVKFSPMLIFDEDR